MTARRTRLHPLFADFLSVELQGRSPSEFEGCHRRAAEWYASQGDDDRTVAHLRESGNDAALGDFVWSRAWRLLAKGQSPTLSRWLEGLAESRVLAHPGLCLTSAWVRTQEGDMAQVVHFATQARALVRQDEFFQPYASHVDVADAVIGREGTASIIDLCNSALESADSSDPWRSLAYFMRGVAHLHFGTVDEGMADLAAGCQIAKELDISHVRAQCLAAQATVMLSLGQAGVAGGAGGRCQSCGLRQQARTPPDQCPHFSRHQLWSFWQPVNEEKPSTTHRGLCVSRRSWSRSPRGTRSKDASGWVRRTGSWVTASVRVSLPKRRESTTCRQHVPRCSTRC